MTVEQRSQGDSAPISERMAGTTAYTIAGKGPPVVLIHGVGLRREIWAPQTSALLNDFTVIAYDTLGHGLSATPPVTVTLADYANQLESLLDHLDVARAAVVGHSMGALIALEFALTRPDRVQGVAALNAVFCRTPEQSAVVQGRAALIALEGVEATLGEILTRWFRDAPTPVAQSTVAWVSGMLRNVDPVGYQRAYQLFALSDRAHEHRLGQLSVPALFMTGAFDPNSNVAMSRTMAGLASRARIEILPDARHMMTVTHAPRVNEVLKDFLISFAT